MRVWRAFTIIPLAQLQKAVLVLLKPEYNCGPTAMLLRFDTMPVCDEEIFRDEKPRTGDFTAAVFPQNPQPGNSALARCNHIFVPAAVFINRLQVVIAHCALRLELRLHKHDQLRDIENGVSAIAWFNNHLGRPLFSV